MGRLLKPIPESLTRPTINKTNIPRKPIWEPPRSLYFWTCNLSEKDLLEYQYPIYTYYCAILNDLWRERYERWWEDIFKDYTNSEFFDKLRDVLGNPYPAGRFNRFVTNKMNVEQIGSLPPYTQTDIDNFLLHTNLYMMIGVQMGKGSTKEECMSRMVQLRDYLAEWKPPVSIYPSI